MIEPDAAVFSPLPLSEFDLSPPRPDALNATQSKLDFESARRHYIPRYVDTAHVNGFFYSLKIILWRWVNVLLAFIPVSLALQYSDNNISISLLFAATLISVIPLSRMLGFLTEDLELRCRSKGLGRLLVVTMGNLVPLVFALILLIARCDFNTVQSTMIGSILTNLLVVIGGSFFIGGIKWRSQGYAQDAAKSSAATLLVSTVALLIPATFDAVLPQTLGFHTEADLVKLLSRGIAIVLIVMYVGYNVFQLITHKHMYERITKEMEIDEESGTIVTADGRVKRQNQMHRAMNRASLRPDAASAPARLARRIEYEEEKPRLHVGAALMMMALVIGLLCFLVLEFAAQLDILTANTEHLSTEWIGLVIIPVIANGSEQFSSLRRSRNDRLDYVMGIAIGKSIQIALFTLPLLVIVSGGMKNDFTLLFTPFASLVLFLGVLATTYIISNGESTHYFHGILLLMTGAIIAISFYFWPSGQNTDLYRFLVLTCALRRDLITITPNGTIIPAN